MLLYKKFYQVSDGDLGFDLMEAFLELQGLFRGVMPDFSVFFVCFVKKIHFSQISVCFNGCYFIRNFIRNPMVISDLT